MDDSDDAEALRAARRDPERFSAFYRRHNTRVLRYFAVRTRQPEVAADLTAETFAAAYANLDRYKPDRGPAVAWLFTIARNLLIDAQRQGQVQTKARRRLSLEPLALDDDDIRRIDELASLPSVDLLLQGLSANERMAVTARIIDERSYDDIAADLRCTPNVVRQRVSRGLARIRSSLEGES